MGTTVTSTSAGTTGTNICANTGTNGNTATSISAALKLVPAQYRHYWSQHQYWYYWHEYRCCAHTTGNSTLAMVLLVLKLLLPPVLPVLVQILTALILVDLSLTLALEHILLTLVLVLPLLVLALMV